MKKLFFVLLGIILFICAIDATLDFVYFAGPGKEKAKQILSHRLGTKVEMDKLVFRLVSGFSARNLIVYDPSGKTPILKVEKFEVDLSYLSLLTKKLEFKTIRLKNPELQLTRNQDGEWNIPIKLNNDQKNPFTIRKFKIKNGRLELTDNFISSDPFKFDLKQLNVKAKWSKGGKLKGNVAFKLLDENSLVELKSTVNFLSNELFAQGTAAKIPIKIFKPYLRNALPDLKGISGKTDAQFEIFGILNKKLTLKTKLLGSQVGLSFTPWQIQGDLRLKANCIYDNKKWSYKGEAHLSNTDLHTSLIPAPVQNLNGQVLFENNFITSNGIEGTFEGNSIRARGSIENLKNPRFHASLFTDIRPDKIYTLAKIFQPTLLKDSTLTGKSFTQINIRTDETTGRVTWNGKLYLKEASFSMDKVQLLYNRLNGVISFSENSIELQNLKGDLTLGQTNQLKAKTKVDGKWSQNIEISLEKGTINSSWLKNPVTEFNSNIYITPTNIDVRSFSGKTIFQSFKGNSSINFENSSMPELSFYLSSPEYSVLFQGRKENEFIKIDKLSGYGLGATFDVTGEVGLTKNQTSKLKIDSKLDTIALKKAWPTLWEKFSWLKRWSPKGTFQISGIFKGALAQKKDVGCRCLG